MSVFKDLKISAELLQSLEELKYHTPTPIQHSAIPLLLQGQDVAGQAETGSGKTAAFGLSILHQITTDKQEVQAVVIVPTRELAVQIRHELKKYGKYINNLKISAFYGGHSFSQERASLSHPPHILVGTPGRITDHLNRKTLDFGSVKHLVLDEADKLLEMGFEEEIDHILSFIPSKRQTILFSATMPEDVKELITNSLKHPQFVKASQQAIPDQVKLIGIKVEHTDRKEVVVNLVRSIDSSGTVIFTNTRIAADEIAALLLEQGISVKALHGGMEQVDRDKTMTLFRNKTTQVLVATDVAARGLDIASLKNIIHYELPIDAAAYLHRSGRTGRAGKSGTVYTLATTRDEKQLRDWEQVRMDEWLAAKDLKEKATNAPVTTNSAFATLHISGGRKDKISPRDIVGALIAEAGLKADQIGKIEIQDRMSFVAVPEEQSTAIAEKLSNGKIKGRKFRVNLVKD
jgi:ATP-dependent RNA helicase DbpA